ncbi:MAG TPA: response regulator transcription factor [Thermoanaerobaculia bacterium]|nr:response regulator transcription factor [Thermoanaerobaculia bacterium]
MKELLVAVNDAPQARRSQPLEAPPRPLTLAILDPHRLFRECLAAALSEDASFLRVDVGDVDRAAIARLGGNPVDVLVLGCGDAAELRELLRVARAHWPDAKVLVLSAEDGQEQALALLCDGVRGCLFRDQSLQELREAILEVAAGATVCAPRVANLLFSRLSELGRERRRNEQLEALDLTARELEILRLIADGLQNREIARRLYLSVHTVKNHVHNIIKRLGVESRWSAVTHACDKGWLQPRRRLRVS